MSLAKLLRPQSLAVAGGDWADAVVAGNRRLGFTGPIVHIHPKRRSNASRSYVTSVEALTDTPDCVALGVSHAATIDMVRALRERGAEAAVCFASGFAERLTPEGQQRTEALQEAAGSMSILGPNCYGFINYLDRVAVWPDQVGGTPVDRGVALICQSGAIAFTLMSSQRSLPISHLISVGNQLRVGVHDLIDELSGDERVSAIGLYIEGVPDVAAFIRAAGLARQRGVPIALIKSGRTEAAAKVALSHTASLSGADDLYQALFSDLGIARCSSLAELVETLKLLHTAGPIGSRARVLITGCSGGDMAMTADLSQGIRLDYAPIPDPVKTSLRSILGDDVSLSNPLDFQTYIWPEPRRIEAMFTALTEAGYDGLGFVIDHPDPEFCDVSGYERPLNAFLSAVSVAGLPAAAITSLPETLPPRLRAECLRQNVAPLQGLPEALRAFANSAAIRAAWEQNRSPRIVQAAQGHGTQALTERDAKSLVAEAGIRVPRSIEVCGSDVVSSANTLGLPVVLKISSSDILHKTEVGGVAVNLRTEAEVTEALCRMQHLGDRFLVEEMVQGAVAEVLIGAVVDPQFGAVMLVGAGGVMTELQRDTAQILFPVTPEVALSALRSLRMWSLLDGYRGRPKADVEELVETIVAAAAFVEERAPQLAAFEMNPVFVRASGNGVVAADVVLCLSQ